MTPRHENTADDDPDSALLIGLAVNAAAGAMVSGPTGGADHGPGLVKEGREALRGESCRE